MSSSKVRLADGRAGTELDVWEIVELLREYGRPAKLRHAFPGLSSIAIEVARAYSDAYPEEIQTFLELNAQSPQEIGKRLPWLIVVRA